MAKIKGLISSAASSVSRVCRSAGTHRYTQAVLGSFSLGRQRISNHAPLYAFLLVAVLGLIALHVQQVRGDHRLYMNSFDSCIRASQVRINQDQIVDDVRIMTQILQSHPTNPQLTAKLKRETSKLHIYLPVNCATTVTKP